MFARAAKESAKTSAVQNAPDRAERLHAADEAQGPETLAAELERPPASAGLQWSFSNIPLFPSGGYRSPPHIRLQRKLAIGSVDDPQEREADAIADAVMRMPDPALAVSATPPQVSRKGAECEEEEKTLQMKPTAASPASAVDEVPPIVHEVLRQPGQPLDALTRAFFEARLGHDFSQVRICKEESARPLGDVRVHTDQRASDAARSVAARAFTLNEHIVLGEHQYAPNGLEGRRLLAHELVHTIQQRVAPATPTIRRDPIPGWNFKPSDFARLQEAGVGIAMASDSSFFPAKLQENLLKTIAFVLGPAITPPATEGINAVDFFHGHLVVKKDPKTAVQAKGAEAKGLKFKQELGKERTKALGEVKYSKGYPLTEENVGKYTKAVEKVLPSFGTLLDETSKLPGAAVMYHTFEFNQPGDIKAQGKKLAPEDPRRHYVTPLDTNQPKQYSPPSGGYESEYTHITSFSFLVDDKGKVHVRPFGPESGFTSLELSTITGTTFARTSEFEG
jgi:hypothetical protein